MRDDSDGFRCEKAHLEHLGVGVPHLDVFLLHVSMVWKRHVLIQLVPEEVVHVEPLK